MQHPFGEKNLVINRILGRTFLNPLGQRAYLLAGRAAGLGVTSRVLDVGAGRGTGALLLARRFGCRVTGIEPSEAMAAEAIRRAQRVRDARVEFRAASLEAFANPRPFDLVCCFDVLGFVAHRRKALRHVASLLRKGGWLCLTDYFCARRVPSAKRLVKAWHLRSFGRCGAIAADLDAAGFLLRRYEDTTESYRGHWLRVWDRLSAQKGRVAAAVGDEAYRQYRSAAGTILAATEEGSFGHAFVMAQRA